MIRRRSKVRVVGIGASAGGLEPILQILSRLPRKSEMCFVVIQHLDPTHASSLKEILGRATSIPVSEIKTGERAKKNNVYVIPPNSDALIEGGRFLLQKRPVRSARHEPINLFFKSLARTEKHRAIGVVLSGTGADGALGLKAIREAGGKAIVQSPESAKHSGMPNSAINFDGEALVLEPEAIATEIMKSKKFVTVTKDPLEQIIDKVCEVAKLDFSDYKSGTITRRIKRRMSALKIKNFSDYANYIKRHSDEANDLAKEFLIHVTKFFRDAPSFEGLRRHILPKIFKSKTPGSGLRIWVPGCATGEEAYSIAISVFEYMEAKRLRFPIQIFATDVSEEAIRIARRGIYSEKIAADISPSRLKKYFSVDKDGYQVQESIRRVCLFSVHDVSNDPPFARLDLISCHNVLIYFNADLQRRVIPIFHFALNPGGFLWLSRSEGLSGFKAIFRLVDERAKIYSKTGEKNALRISLQRKRFLPSASAPAELPSSFGSSRSNAQREAERLILEEYAPPGVVVDSHMEILQARGRTTPFLRLASGSASLNLIKMAHPDIATVLLGALQSSKRSGKAVEKMGLEIGDNGRAISFDLKVQPIQVGLRSKEKYYSVVFVPAPSAGAAKKKLRRRLVKEGSKTVSVNQQQLLLEEFENTREELVSANEELQSSNEELQSANEELETAKEELQSNNEELSTLNEELQARNAEVVHLSNDLSNLLVSADIPLVMVDTEGRIRRFTPKAEKFFNLLPSDIGRPIAHIKPKLKAADLDDLVSEVIARGSVNADETKDSEGRWQHLVVRPYKTSESKIEGAVIALFDIDELKRSNLALKASHEETRTIIESLPVAVLVVEPSMKVRLANRQFCETFKVVRDEVEGGRLFKMVGGLWNIPTLKSLVDQAFSKGKVVQGLEVEHIFPKIGQRAMLLSARPVTLAGASSKVLLLAIEDVTNRMTETKERLIQSSKMAALGEMAAGVAHEINNPLSILIGHTEKLKKIVREEPLNEGEIDQRIARIMTSADRAVKIVKGLQLYSRNADGDPFSKTSIRSIITETVELCRARLESANVEVRMGDTPDIQVECRPSEISQLLVNLLNNAIDAIDAVETLSEKWISIEVKKNSAGQLEIAVTDSGPGISKEVAAKMMQPFFTTKEVGSGTGLGLSIAHGIAQHHRGSLELDSSSSNTKFVLILPLSQRQIEKARKKG